MLKLNDLCSSSSLICSTALKHGKTILFAATLLSSSSSLAYLTVGESADVTPKGVYKLGVEPQVRLSEGSGANLSVFVDSGIQEDLSWRVSLGTGETDLSANASIKWVPYPDFEKQPAIGIRGDFGLGREASETFTTVRVGPVISKQMPTDEVLFTPYLAVPMGMLAFQGKSETFAQLALGSDIHVNDWKAGMFNVELGANLNRAFSYISLNFVYLMNEGEGFKLRRSKE